MDNPSRQVWRDTWIPKAAVLLVAVLSVGLARAAETRLPDNSRLALVLERAFWSYANPTNPGTVTVYVERRAGAWDPTFSADAQKGLNVAHDGYLVASSREVDTEMLRVRLHIRRDRWMDVVGEPAYEVRFMVEGDRCNGAVDLRKAAKGKVYVANYLYCVLEVKESGFYRLDSNANPKGVRWTVAYLSGEKVMPKDYLAGIPFAYCYRSVFGLDMDGADRLDMNMALCTAATIFSGDGARMQSLAVGGGPDGTKQ